MNNFPNIDSQIRYAVYCILILIAIVGIVGGLVWFGIIQGNPVGMLIYVGIGGCCAFFAKEMNDKDNDDLDKI